MPWITPVDRELIERVLDQVDVASDCSIGNDEVAQVREILDHVTLRASRPFPTLQAVVNEHVKLALTLSNSLKAAAQMLGRSPRFLLYWKKKHAP